MEPDYYTVLGISTTATLLEVKAAYKRLALKYHPDKNPGNARAEEQFKLVSAAYQTLSNPGKRARYDLRLQYQRTQQHTIRQNPQQYDARYYQTRPPASVSERHYRTIRRDENRFSRKDWYITFAFVGGLLLISLLLKVVMDSVTGEDKYKTALVYIQHGNYSSAHRLLSDAIAFQPENAGAYQARASIELNIFEDYHAALEDLNQAIALQAKPSAVAYYMRGRSYQQLEQYGQAEADLTRALQLNKKLWNAYLKRGQVRLFYLHKYKPALQDFSVFLKHSQDKPRRVEALTYRGFGYFKLGKHTLAEQDYRQALALNSQNGRVYYLLGRVEAAQQPDSACVHFGKAYQLGYSAALLELREHCQN
ncbi:DnaJ domain-containing protein [Pontibacter sp. 172403-2]|uniref:tetratricopeptide repeat protein n=1 Tax=Pontibacter rufus TaxID=2791028 RepID=UPI0018AFE469|nr:DnaJ domain-containing protein [Pontibacter sp. 172403-2]MBF9253161.1 DnaJ domain-containing protein [Pontibacter sp. 172403-2]